MSKPYEVLLTRLFLILRNGQVIKVSCEFFNENVFNLCLFTMWPNLKIMKCNLTTSEKGPFSS